MPPTESAIYWFEEIENFPHVLQPGDAVVYDGRWIWFHGSDEVLAGSSEHLLELLNDSEVRGG